MILAIDFDGVVHDYRHPVEGRRMGSPMPPNPQGVTKFERMGAVEAMQYLFDEDHTLIIHTVRGRNAKHIEDWCEYYHIPYHEITDIKPNADAYLDDKAVKFVSWGQAITEMEALEVVS